jgi:hypothetical protein
MAISRLSLSRQSLLGLLALPDKRLLQRPREQPSRQQNRAERCLQPVCNPQTTEQTPNTGEPAPAKAPVFGLFRPCSLVFAET